MSKKFFLMIGALIVIIGVWAISNRPSLQSEAQAGCQLHNVSGWAWSETIGWISFSCKNPESPSSIDWGVDVYPQTGEFQGHAWSENIGWISFNSGDTSSCGSNAALDLTTKKVSGWARALAGGTSNSGGWDGCISLSRINPAYGITYDDINKEFEGFAWGDINVGWIDFNCIDSDGEGDSCSQTSDKHKVALDLSIVPPPCPNCNPPSGPSGPSGPSLSLFSPSFITQVSAINPVIDLSWTSNPATGFTNCSGSFASSSLNSISDAQHGTYDNWHDTRADPPSSLSTVYVPFDTNLSFPQGVTYNLSCDYSNQTYTATYPVVVFAPTPVIQFTYNNFDQAQTPPGHADFAWTLQNVKDCQATSSPTAADWSGSLATSADGTYGQTGITIPNYPTTFTLTCTGLDENVYYNSFSIDASSGPNGGGGPTTTTPKFEEI